MQFSVVALSLVSVALAADAISQIDDGQIQATSATETTAETTAETSAPATETTAETTAETSAPATETEETSTLQISTQTENGANQVAGGAAFAGLIAAGAMLI